MLFTDSVIFSKAICFKYKQMKQPALYFHIYKPLLPPCLQNTAAA